MDTPQEKVTIAIRYTRPNIQANNRHHPSTPPFSTQHSLTFWSCASHRAISDFIIALFTRNSRWLISTTTVLPASLHGIWTHRDVDAQCLRSLHLPGMESREICPLGHRPSLNVLNDGNASLFHNIAVAEALALRADQTYSGRALAPLTHCATCVERGKWDVRIVSSMSLMIS